MAVVRGLCRKAASVARSVKLLADFEAGKTVTPKKAPLDFDMMILFLIQMAKDHEMEADPDEPINFSVNRDGLDKIPWVDLVQIWNFLNRSSFVCVIMRSNTAIHALAFSLAQVRDQVGSAPFHRN